MEISAGSFVARSQWESCRDFRRETKFLAVKVLLLSHREGKFSAAKIGSMRTIFTFTLTIIIIKLPDADRTMSYIAVPGIVNKIVFSLGPVLKLNYPLYGTVST